MEITSKLGLDHQIEILEFVNKILKIINTHDSFEKVLAVFFIVQNFYSQKVQRGQHHKRSIFNHQNNDV